MKMNINENGDLLNEIVDNLEQIIQYIRDNLNNCKEKNNKINLEEEIDEKVDKKFLGEKRKYSEIFEDKENDKEQCEKNNNKRIKSKEILIELIKKIESVIIKINNKNNIIKNSNQEKVYSDGKYIGQIMNNLREGNGIMYYNNGDKFEVTGDRIKNLRVCTILLMSLIKEINMMAILRMINSKAREFIIGKMEKNIKGIGKIVKEKEKEYIIIIVGINI